MCHVSEGSLHNEHPSVPSIKEAHLKIKRRSRTRTLGLLVTNQRRSGLICLFTGYSTNTFLAYSVAYLTLFSIIELTLLRSSKENILSEGIQSVPLGTHKGRAKLIARTEHFISHL